MNKGQDGVELLRACGAITAFFVDSSRAARKSQNLRLAVSLLLSAASAVPAALSVQATGARIACEEPEYYFGELENTREAEHEFILRNEGDETLVISRVRSGCGCTVARAADREVKPGGRTALRVRFSLKGRSGHQRQQIEVHSNDPAQPVFFLFMTGEAVASLTITPDRIFWGNIHRNAESERSVELKFRLDVPARLKKAAASSAMFAVEQLTLEEGKSFEIRVKTVPPLPPGVFDSALRIETDHGEHREISIPMSGRVVDDLFAMPAELVLDADRPEPAEYFLVVRSVENKPFIVLSVEPPLCDIAADIRSTGSDRALIRLKNVSALPELDGKIVRIVTDHPAMPELSVPIRVMRLRDLPTLSE